MANLGNLWFGADIDLTNLKKKIEQGNREVLDALKLKYDAKSYAEMTSRLRNDLSKEVFDIKINSNVESLKKSLNSALGANVSLGKGFTVQGIDAMRLKSIQLERILADTNADITQMQRKLDAVKSAMGSNTLEAKRLREEILAAKQAKLEDAYAVKQSKFDIREAAIANRALAQSKREASAAAKDLEKSSLRLNTTLAGGVHVSTELGSALSSLFGIHVARQFLGTVIEIGGQLEMQRVSIGAILDDVSKANTLFNQVKSLAVKSPFGVLELDQFSKQLSAYGFEYHELYDTVKRIADISAGAGTDMSRLANALGHVRSATKLTGMTLRQFSMNNIPMLKMLADYYSELEHRVVTTAEVTKRISESKVSYEDVIEQIRRMTNEGGMFFNMQEKVADTLAAKWKNLHDAMDIMYGDVADSFVGDGLKEAAEILTDITKRWKNAVAVLGGMIALFAVNKAAVMANTLLLGKNANEVIRNTLMRKQQNAQILQSATAYRQLTAQEQAQVAASKQLTAEEVDQLVLMGELSKEELLRAVAVGKLTVEQAELAAATFNVSRAELTQIASTKGLKLAMKDLGTTIKGVFSSINAATLVTAAIAAGVEIYTAYTTWRDGIESEVNTFVESAKSAVKGIKEEMNLNATNGKPADEMALRERVKSMKTLLKDNGLYTNEIINQINEAKTLGEQYDILNGYMETALEQQEGLTKSTKDWVDTIAASRSQMSWKDWAEFIAQSSGAAGMLYSGIKALFSSDEVFGSGKRIADFFGSEDIKENLGELAQSMEQFQSIMNEANAAGYAEAMQSVIDKYLQLGVVDKELAAQMKGQSLYDQVRLLADSPYWDKFVDEVGKSDASFAKFAKGVKEKASDTTSRLEDIVEGNIPKMFKFLAKARGMELEEYRTWLNNHTGAIEQTIYNIIDYLTKPVPILNEAIKGVIDNWLKTGKFTTTTKLFKQTKEVKDVVEQTEELLNNLDDNKPTGHKEDTVLKRWNERYEALKRYYDAVQKYVKIGYSTEEAMSKAEKNEGVQAGLFGGSIATYDEYVKRQKALLKEIVGSTKERRDLQQKIREAIGEWDRNSVQTQMDKNVSVMKEYIANVQKQWSLYYELFSKTGDKDFSKLAFSNGRLWDDTSRNMLNEFNAKREELGVYGTIHWDMNEAQLKDALRDADDITQKQLVDLAQAIQKITSENYTRLLKESASAYEKSLTASEKLVAAEQKLINLEQERNRVNDESQAVIYDNLIKGQKSVVANLQWDAFKETENWGKIFGNLEDLSTSTLKSMIDKLRELAPQIKENVEDTKALYEAIEKMEEVIIKRNPFAMMAGSLKNKGTLKGYLKTVTEMSGMPFAVSDKNLANILGVRLGTKVTKEMLENGIMEQENDFIEGVGKLDEKFRALQDVLSPVIDLFSELGKNDLSQFFQAGSNALGSAAQAASSMKALGLGKAAPWAAGAAAALSVATTLISLHDEALQKEIDASKERQKEMEYMYKNLEHVLDQSLSGAYGAKASTSQLLELENKIMEWHTEYVEETDRVLKNFRKYTKETSYQTKDYISAATEKQFLKASDTQTIFDVQLANLMAQQDEVRLQLEKEQKKKKRKQSKEAIAQYKQTIEELENEINEFAKEMANALYGIDVKSWAKTLGDTLFDAWKKGESGIDAYRGKLSELIADTTKNILSQSIIGDALKPVEIFIERMMKESSGELDPLSYAEGIADKMEEAFAKIDSTLFVTLDKVDAALQKRGFVSWKESAESSTTAAGIKGMTESQADIIGSYVNGIRGDLAVLRDNQIPRLQEISAACVRGNVLAEQQVQHLTQIAENTYRNAEYAQFIYSLLKNITIGNERFYVK